MIKRTIFLTVTFLLASFITACTTTGTQNGQSYTRSTAIDRAR